MKIDTKYLFIIIERDIMRELDVRVLIGLGKRRQPLERFCVTTWPLEIEASWNWLPRIDWRAYGAIRRDRSPNT